MGRRNLEHDADYDLGLDPYRDKPRKANRREIAALLNRAHMTLNYAGELLSEIGREIGSRERSDEQRPRRNYEGGSAMEDPE